METKLKTISKSIYKELGHGYSECTQHRALELELQMNDIKYSTEVVLPIYYKKHYVGYHRLDLLLYENDENIIAELKAIPRITMKDIAQVTRYMKQLQHCKLGYLINFGSKLEIYKVYLRNEEYKSERLSI